MVGSGPPRPAQPPRVLFHCRTSGRRERVARAFSTVFGDPFSGRVPSEISVKAWRDEYTGRRYGVRGELPEVFRRIACVLALRQALSHHVLPRILSRADDGASVEALAPTLDGRAPMMLRLRHLIGCLGDVQKVGIASQW